MVGRCRGKGCCGGWGSRVVEGSFGIVEGRVEVGIVVVGGRSLGLEGTL